MSTSSSFVIDTYSWVEHLLGSKAGCKAKSYLESDKALTPSIVLTELRKWFLREIKAHRRTEREMQRHFEFVETLTEIVPLDTTLAVSAGETDFVMKKRTRDWPIADSGIYATVKIRAAEVVTGDPHFKGLRHHLHAIMLLHGVAGLVSFSCSCLSNRIQSSPRNPVTKAGIG
jgi:predicted nucleic acid-binding protein